MAHFVVESVGRRERRRFDNLYYLVGITMISLFFFVAFVIFGVIDYQAGNLLWFGIDMVLVGANLVLIMIDLVRRH